MNLKKHLPKLTYALFGLFCAAFLAFMAYNPSHAYFQVILDSTGINTAKIDLLFDKYDASIADRKATDASTDAQVTDVNNDGLIIDLKADWGTPTNPYVIDDNNHISNLSVLQKSQYFKRKGFQCHFVVCTPLGHPVAIDCEQMEITPVGSHDNPFTGNMQGAPFDVPTDLSKYTIGNKTYSNKYSNYSVTQSAIANLKVIASDATPDIGFFGTLGYVGTVTGGGTNADTGLQSPSTFTGYAAYIDNLLFADITISDSQSVVGDWFTSHLFNGVNETHHVGIVAGHAEWATLKNISVYYTPDTSATNAAKTKVPAFALTGTSTNYYSITGILGTLRNVNPPATETANTYTSQGAISDKDLSEELLSGGGGTGSGMLTGYMLAENIFNRNTNTGAISLLDGYAIAYDVKNMKDSSNSSIFTEVHMQERSSGWPWVPWEDHYYYYFADTVFTFAMSAQKDDPNGYVDYVVKIWDLDAEDSPPMISLTTSTSDWQIKTDPTRSQTLFKLSAASELSPGGYYILLYKDGDKYYTFDIMSTETNGFVNSFTPYVSDTDTFTDTNGNGVWDDADTFTDTNGNDVWDDAELFYDINGNGVYDTAPEPFIDSEGGTEGVYDEGEEFEDVNGNDVWDSEITEPHVDNPDNKTDAGVWDDAEPLLTDRNGNKAWDDAEPYVDGNKNGKYDTDPPTYRVKTDALGNITEMYLQNAGKVENCTYSFQYEVKNNITFTSYDGSKRFGVTAAANRNNWQWGELEHHNGTQSPYTGGDLSFETIYWYDWDIKFAGTNSNIVTVEGNIAASSWLVLGTVRAYYSLQLYFQNGKFVIERDGPDDSQNPTLNMSGKQTQFLLYKVEKVTGATVDFKDYMVKDTVTPQNFDLSQNVFFCDPYVLGANEDTLDLNKLDRDYVLTPLLQKQWNNGKGQYLTSLNHAVKIASQTPENFQLTLSNTIIGDWFGDIFNTNEGGVVIAELGTTGINYAIPTGSIAFYINKASADDPSEINIIVAVNPNSGAQTVSLWGPQALDSATSSFSSASPSQAFALPTSTTASAAQTENFVHLEGYYVADDTTDTGYRYVDEDRYTWLGGEVAFVGCTFSVAEPGVYLIGSSTGPMTVSYFSVTGAAGSGGDGTGGSPLGDIDFVYDNNNGTIITVDKKFEDAHILSGEDVTTTYYPSYFYLRLLPKKDKTTIPQETVYVRRYVDTTTAKESLTRQRRRWLTYSCSDPDTSHLSLLDMYEDNVKKNGQTVSD